MTIHILKISALMLHTVKEHLSHLIPPARHRYQQTLVEWTDTSLRYSHWRMCFERLLQAFARWQPGILFDTAAQPILEYRWIDSYTQLTLQTQFKVATVYSIHTQSLAWCSTGLVGTQCTTQRDDGLCKPCALCSRSSWLHDNERFWCRLSWQFSYESSS